MKKITDWLQDNKIAIISIIILLALFFTVLPILNSMVYRPLKTERDQLKDEKKQLLKDIKSLSDSIEFYSNNSQTVIQYDTVIVNKVIKEKNKTNEEIARIPHFSIDSNLKLHSILVQEYIQTGFTPDSSER